MENNEYRRSLIMLRSLIPGYSGHARLEIRTLTGSLNIVATLPPGAQNIQAVLAGNRRGTYFAAPLGTLRRDLRGQWGLSVNFDPRSIGGRPLDAYSHLILADTAGRCTPVLAGNLNGSCFPDWSKLRETVCSLFVPARPDTPILPTPSIPVRPDIPAQPDTPILPTPSIPNQDEAPANPDTPSLPTPELPHEPEIPPQPPTPIQPRDEEPAEEDTLQWDFSSENPDVPAFSRTGWKFTRVSLPEGCPYTYSYVGVPDNSDAPPEICCAIPAVYTPEPPPGLDDYEWSGGAGQGWWIRCYIPK